MIGSADAGVAAEATSKMIPTLIVTKRRVMVAILFREP
jgi:hypothetical protein